MKKIVAAVFFAFVSFIAKPQSIPNAGFEDWFAGPGYSDPDSWGTINPLVASVLPGGTSLQTTDVHSGLSALKLENKAISGNIAPGVCVTGSINGAGFVSGGLAFNQRPVYISGWYKFLPSEVDTGYVQVRLTKWNGSQRDTIAFTQLNFTDSVANYQGFIDSIEYVSSELPDTLIIYLTSGGHNRVVGTKLFIDDLAFIDVNNTGIENHKDDFKISIGPNPAHDVITLSFDSENAFAGSLRLIDILGREVYSKNISINQGNQRLQLSQSMLNLARGLYVLSVSTPVGVETAKIIFE